MDDIKLDKVKAIYSYQNGDSYIFSNPETWEEIELKGEDLGDALNYLEEEMPLDVVYYESTAVAVELPTFVEREVTYTEPGLRGDTSGKVMKPARINTGFEVQVPLFVEQGEWIKIDTRTNEYVERVKKYLYYLLALLLSFLFNSFRCSYTSFSTFSSSISFKCSC